MSYCIWAYCILNVVLFLAGFQKHILLWLLCIFNDIIGLCWTSNCDPRAVIHCIRFNSSFWRWIRTLRFLRKDARSAGELSRLRWRSVCRKSSCECFCIGSREHIVCVYPRRLMSELNDRRVCVKMRNA